MSREFVSTTKYVHGTGPGTGYVTAPEWKWVSSAPRPSSMAPVSNQDMSVCCNAVEFAFMIIAWSIARIFRCGRLGKMTYAQLVVKYWKH